MKRRIVNKFDSLGALLAYADPKHNRRSEMRFYGMTTLQARQYVMKGASHEEQRETLQLMEQIDASIEGRTRREYQASPVGAFACVPDYLQGMPNNMRRRVHTESEAAPVRIAVEITVSAGVSIRQLRRRGAAIAALVARMSETRPTELYIMWAVDSSQDRSVSMLGTVKLDTSPLSVGHLVAALASEAMARAVMFPVFYTQRNAPSNANDVDGIPWFMGRPDARGRTEAMREALGFDEADILIPGGYLSDADIMLRDPVAWVNHYLDKQRQLDEAHPH